MTTPNKKPDPEALRIQALNHARNCVVAHNHAGPNELDQAALRELDVIIETAEAQLVKENEQRTWCWRIRMHVRRAVERVGTFRAEELGDPSLAAFARLGTLAIAWADALEARYTGPQDSQGIDTSEALMAAERELLLALLPPGATALRYR